MVAQPVRLDRRSNDALAPAAVEQLLNQRDILFRRVAQRVWLRFVFFCGRDKREVRYPSPVQIQRVFITKLAIKVSNACNALGQVPLGLTARVDLLEQGAHQPSIAITAVRRDTLRPSKAKASRL